MYILCYRCASYKDY